MDKFLYKRNTGDYNLLMAFPAVESFALASLGYLWLFKIADTFEGINAQRASTDNIPYIENLNAIAFSLSFDFDFAGTFEIMEKLNIPLFAKERNDNYPIIFAGGPAITMNPRPYEAFFDFMLIGDGEENFKQILEILKENNNKQEILKLKKRPRKMECYDISNISGVLSVASMVVFWEGKPDKAKYRRFRIKTVEGPNDFASMNEVLTRRFEESKKPNNDDESFSILPDLIVIDGGKGQLSSAYNAMLKCGVNVPMIGLAKKEEEVFLPNQSEPIVLPRSHNSLKMLQRIRDESHRFAIMYHRSLRNKTQSILHQIEGIGPTKTKLLIKYFKGIDKIKTATKDELRKVKSLTNKDIDNIYKFFNES